MNIDHLSDSELIQYIIKHDSDPIRVRLATYIDNMGRILDGLERAGMDPETCLHENLYESGEYINHLNNEIEILNRELQEMQASLAERETLTVSELIEELRHVARGAEHRASAATKRAREADAERETIRSKMKVWRAISTDISHDYRN
jgi:hypothetical protein